MVLATQCLLQRRPKTLRGPGRRARCGPGVGAKDIILALIARIGIGGGTGHVFEYRGEAIRALSMEQRMTVCNMSIEGGARAGLIAPDDTTFEYLARPPRTRRRARPGTRPSRAGATLPTDDGATLRRDRSRSTRATPRADGHLRHEPRHGHPDHRPRARRPTTPADPAHARGARAGARVHGPAARASRSLGQKVDVVFIGSCTNAPDQRPAPGGRASCEGRTVADGRARAGRARLAAGEEAGRAEGLDEVFRAAGAEWREAGCSMCIAMNGDQLQPGPVRGQHLATATSRAARARAGARSSPRR